MGHHVVPQRYLKGFRTKDSPEFIGFTTKSRTRRGDKGTLVNFPGKFTQGPLILLSPYPAGAACSRPANRG